MHLLPAARQSRARVLALGLVVAMVAGGCGNSGGGSSTPDSGGNGNGVGDTGYRNPKVAPHEWRLRFRRQPDSGLAGLPFGRPVAVEVLDNTGLAANVSLPVELVLQDPTGKARLGGSVLVSSQAGVAVFPDLSVMSAGRDLTLMARSPNADPAFSDRFTRDVSPGRRHVILMVADGWGFKHLEATASFVGNAAPYDGLAMLPMSTWDADVQQINGSPPYDPSKAWSDMNYLVRAATDSASAATALFTGHKTNTGKIAVGVGVGAKRLVSIGELALRNGLGSGAITSVPISHATPAAWAAHNDSRGYYSSLTDEMLFGDPAATGPGFGSHGPIDVLPHVVIGGGHPDFTFGGYVTPAQLTKAKKESGNPGGWQVVEKAVGSVGGEVLRELSDKPSTKRLLGLFGSGIGNIAFRLHDGSGLDPAEPTLAEMTGSALQVLSRQPKGFFLMVEGGAVDWAGHNNNMSQCIGEMIGFSEAVQEVVDWIEDPSNTSDWTNTLLVVTGDHECGLLTAGPGVLPDAPLGAVTNQRIVDEKLDLVTYTMASWDDLNQDSMIDPNEPVHWAWNTSGHSNSLIPCYHKGIESQRFAGLLDGVDPKRGNFIDNIDVFEVMLQVLKR